ncbi:tRNA nucleotidyltransferase (CCA-adding enzyme) [Rhodoblastus acidophilus]|uniref:tRNA nucleotidyltransferase n=1 Tax=Rhodoblastus acidophilus TaxID=1074 RepID=UPI001FEF9924|nr:tRNA nucleotidyltransferase [Rhodoblastus acidophilus]MCW2272980.1 tRNA nucleotidyltransferase (CCA-adding enzyme) [Rhodoblastus acidophilus]
MSIFAQFDPGLGLIRHVALLAEGAAPDPEELDLLARQAEAGFLLDIPPENLWPEFSRALMGRAPGRMLHYLHDIGALEQLLPEVAALYGVPQIAAEPASVDLGDLIEAALDEAAKISAPLAVRFALLVKDVGKSDSPREHLPAHYRHVERGAPRLLALAERLDAPQDCRELAMQALHECERAHKISRMRAGPLAMLLERNGAFDAPERFDHFLSVCACDYRAYPGRAGAPYPKARLIDAALRACREIDAPPTNIEALREARAAAVALALDSCGER